MHSQRDGPHQGVLDASLFHGIENPTQLIAIHSA